jgi:hypothetical protein
MSGECSAKYIAHVPAPNLIFDYRIGFLTSVTFWLQDWRLTLWSDIRTDIMEEGAKQFVKEVKGLHKKVRDEDVFRGVDQAVKNFLVSVPLVADLRSPAMRDRHWEQLMSTTKVRPCTSGLTRAAAPEAAHVACELSPRDVAAECNCGEDGTGDVNAVGIRQRRERVDGQ